MASPLVRVVQMVVLVAVAGAGISAGRSVIDRSLTQLAENATATDDSGFLRTPADLPFRPSVDRAASVPARVPGLPCATAEIRALAGAGWTMTGRHWAAPEQHWRVEAFSLQPPATRPGDDLVARVRRADRRCARAHGLDVVEVGGDYGYLVVRPRVLRVYDQLTNGRVELVTVLQAPGGPGRLVDVAHQVQSAAFVAAADD